MGEKSLTLKSKIGAKNTENISVYSEDFSGTFTATDSFTKFIDVGLINWIQNGAVGKFYETVGVNSDRGAWKYASLGFNDYSVSFTYKGKVDTGGPYPEWYVNVASDGSDYIRIQYTYGGPPTITIDGSWINLTSGLGFSDGDVIRTLTITSGTSILVRVYRNGTLEASKTIDASSRTSIIGGTFGFGFFGWSYGGGEVYWELDNISVVRELRSPDPFKSILVKE